MTSPEILKIKAIVEDDAKAVLKMIKGLIIEAPAKQA